MLGIVGAIQVKRLGKDTLASALPDCERLARAMQFRRAKASPKRLHALASGWAAADSDITGADRESAEP